MSLHDLLGDFEDPEEAEGAEAGEAEGARPRLEVHPEHLENGPEDDHTVELVESRVEVVGAESVHPGQAAGCNFYIRNVEPFLFCLFSEKVKSRKNSTVLWQAVLK